MVEVACMTTYKKTRITYISLQEAAQRLQVTPPTIRRMISRGEIVGYRLGPRVIRVDLDELDRVARVIPAARPIRGGEGAR
jgi:excisionase family DNA binding protein